MFKRIAWRQLFFGLLLFAGSCDSGQSRPADPADPDPRAANGGVEEQVESAEEIAAWLLERYGLENQIPMIRDELIADIPENTPRRDRLIEILTEELEKQLEPKMVQLCVESFTLEELRALRARRETPEIGQAFSRWAAACESDLRAWTASLLKTAHQRLEND